MAQNLSRGERAWLNGQVNQIEQAQRDIEMARQQMASPVWSRMFNNPLTQFGAAMMIGGDPNRTGFGGIGEAVLHTGDYLRQQQEDLRKREMANLMLRSRMAARQQEALEAQRRRAMQQQFVESLPEGQRPAALLAPEEFAKQQAQSAYREEKISTAQRIFREAGGQAGTGKTFPQWYAEDYQSGGTTVNVGGMKESVRKEVMSLGGFEDALNRYEQLLNQYGTEVMPGEGKQRLSTAYTNLLMQAKEAANLGVLSGPDLRLIQSMLNDPTDIAAGVRPTGHFKAQVDELKRMLSSRKSRFEQTIPEAQRGIIETQRAGDGWTSTEAGARWRERK